MGRATDVLGLEKPSAERRKGAKCCGGFVNRRSRVQSPHWLHPSLAFRKLRMAGHFLHPMQKMTFPSSSEEQRRAGSATRRVLPASLRPLVFCQAPPTLRLFSKGFVRTQTWLSGLSFPLPFRSRKIQTKSPDFTVQHIGPSPSGADWLRESADQIAHLRVLRANNQWESLSN